MLRVLPAEGDSRIPLESPLAKLMDTSWCLRHFPYRDAFALQRMFPSPKQALSYEILQLCRILLNRKCSPYQQFRLHFAQVLLPVG